MTDDLDVAISTISLSAADPHRLAQFYADLLGYVIIANEPDWLLLRDPSGRGVSLSCQSESVYARPVWPAGEGDQQMMLHLELQVSDLDRAVAKALAAGATLPDYQPQDDVRVCLDPAGHPFCLWIET